MHKLLLHKLAVFVFTTKGEVLNLPSTADRNVIN